MVFHGNSSETIAQEWASRVCDRMSELQISADEVSETHQIIYSFCITAVDLLREDPTVKLPMKKDPMPLDDEKAHLIIDLFLRGVNQCSSFLRKAGTDWETRKTRVEVVAWKVFNLAKLLVALQLEPIPMFRDLLQQDKDLKIMMKHGTEELIRQMQQETPL